MVTTTGPQTSEKLMVTTRTTGPQTREKLMVMNGKPRATDKREAGDKKTENHGPQTCEKLMVTV